MFFAAQRIGLALVGIMELLAVPLREHFRPETATVPDVVVELVPLALYDCLLPSIMGYEPTESAFTFCCWHGLDLTELVMIQSSRAATSSAVTAAAACGPAGSPVQAI